MEMSKIVIGAMRLRDRESGVATVRAGIDAGFTYIDTSPCYGYASEAECSEAWVGEAVSDVAYRERVMVSTKCTPGNGGMELGEEFVPTGGFGVRSVEQLDQMFDQSLTRLGLGRVDYYHLWTTHTAEQFAEATKPGGWLEGVKGRSDQWDHLGVTTHTDTGTIIGFLESGLFETVTMPLNVINTARMGVVEYCRDKGIKVIAMNPLAGGFLTLRDDIKELAFRFLMRLENVHVLVGFTSPEEVAYAKWIQDTMDDYPLSADEILAKIDTMMDTTEPRCTSCGYCHPCPQGIVLGSALSYYNAYKYLGMEGAKDAFLGKQWEDDLQLSLCTGCGECETRCPNALPVRDIIEAAKAAFYGE